MFSFPDLPRIVQDKIIDIICDKNHPKDGQNFAITSKLNYFLFKNRNRERKQIQQLPMMLGPDVYLYLQEMRELGSEEAVLQYFSRIAVTDAVHLEYCTQQPMSTEILRKVLPHLLGAIRYAQVIHIYITVELKEENEEEFINLFESLECAHSFHLALIGGYDDETINIKRLVNAMHGVKSVHFNGRFIFDDDIWDLLARKSTRECPVENLNLPPTANFTLAAMERFFVTAYLGHSVNIRITEPDDSKTFAYIDMLRRIGRLKTCNKTFVSFVVRNSNVTIHFRSHYTITTQGCRTPMRAYDPNNPHPCDPLKATISPLTKDTQRVPRFFHP